MDLFSDADSCLSEFLESFYMKYGGFIPLSETDVLEYLKKKGSSDLSNRLEYADTHNLPECFYVPLYVPSLSLYY